MRKHSIDLKEHKHGTSIKIPFITRFSIIAFPSTYRVPTSTGKPGKSKKKSSMHGKIMEFEKYGKIMEFCESVCLTACFLATGGLRFYCFKMQVWSTTGSTLVLPYIL